MRSGFRLANQADLKSEAASAVESASRGRWSYPQKMVALSHSLVNVTPALAPHSP